MKLVHINCYEGILNWPVPECGYSIFCDLNGKDVNNRLIKLKLN